MADEVTRSGRAEERVAAERQAEAEELAAAAARGAAGAEPHTVQDSYVARRLAQEAAARAAAEEREAVENAAVRAELDEESPAGLYMMLGVLVAALLLAVIWVSGTQQELPATVIQRARPAAMPMPTGERSGLPLQRSPLGAPPADPTMPADSPPPSSDQPAAPVPGTAPAQGSPAGAPLRAREQGLPVAPMTTPPPPVPQGPAPSPGLTPGAARPTLPHSLPGTDPARPPVQRGEPADRP